MKLSLKNILCLFMIAFVFLCNVCMGGGGINFSYAAESTSEISAEPSSVSSESENFFVRAFHSITNLISSFFSWSIETFGNVIGFIVGLLGIGTPTVIILGIIKKVIGFFASILIKKHIILPLKRTVNKYTVDRYGVNVFKNESPKKETVEYKRELKDVEIMAITGKYGFKPDYDEDEYEGHEVYMIRIFTGFTCYGIFFCDDGVRTLKGLFFPQEKDFLSYDSLRNDEDITMRYLKLRYEGFPDVFYDALMELKEA